MTNQITTGLVNSHSLNEKVKFLSDKETYAGTSSVEVLETHMSWIFLTDQYAFKLKKPVRYEFLDFTSINSRYNYCKEEVQINKPLAGDIYLDVIPLVVYNGVLQLNGEGVTIDWLVKMKRLPLEYMLHTAMSNGTVRNDWVQQAAEMLVDFYLASPPVKIDPQHFRQQIVNDIEINSADLLREEFKLPKSLIIGVTTDLLHFTVKNADLFDRRIAEGRIVDGHGDLRPEHICLAPKPVIIDRIEFNRDLRIIDIAEELSFLALECEMLVSPFIGQLFLNVYKWKSLDKIPETLICFYKAKRAFLRAKLSILHLLEKKYQTDEQKWKNRCSAYLQAADAYCERLAKKC